MDAIDIVDAASGIRGRLLDNGLLAAAELIDQPDRGGITITEPPPACPALLLASLARFRPKRPVFYIAHDEERAERLAREAKPSPATSL